MRILVLAILIAVAAIAGFAALQESTLTKEDDLAAQRSVTSVRPDATQAGQSAVLLTAIVSRYVAKSELHSVGGQECFLDIDGDKYRCRTRDDNRDVFYPTGEQFSTVSLSNGLEDGDETMWFKNGVVMARGAWSQGRRSGYWEYFDASGLIVEIGSYEDGFRSGFWKTWYRNGQRESEGAYFRQFRTGNWVYWKDDGTVDNERSGTYEDDKRVGL